MVYIDCCVQGLISSKKYLLEYENKYKGFNFNLIRTKRCLKIQLPFTQGRLEIITGPVGSIKDSLLEQEVNRLVHSKFADKFGLVVVQHPKDNNGSSRRGEHSSLVTEKVDNIFEQIKQDTRILILGGASHYKDPNIVHLVNSLVESGRIVVASGLNLDSQGQPYNHMPSLMARAHAVTLAKAVCSYGNCHNTEANRSIKINGNFKAQCPTHYYRNVSGSKTEAGTLTLYVGSMFADKSTGWRTHIKKLKEAGFNPLVIKHAGDERCGLEDEIWFHDGSKYPATNIAEITELDDLLKQKPNTQDICIDEGQFFPGIYDKVFSLMSQGYNINMTGLPLTFNLSSFGEVPKLMCLADTIFLNTAICVQCGHPASYSQRLKPIEGIVQPAPFDDMEFLPGAAESYEARCFDCLEIPGREPNKYQIEKLKLK